MWFDVLYKITCPLWLFEMLGSCSRLKGLSLNISKATSWLTANLSNLWFSEANFCISSEIVLSSKFVGFHLFSFNAKSCIKLPDLTLGFGKLCKNKPASSLKTLWRTAPRINEHERQNARLTEAGSRDLKFKSWSVQDESRGRCISHSKLLFTSAKAVLLQIFSLRSAKERVCITKIKWIN